MTTSLSRLKKQIHTSPFFCENVKSVIWEGQSCYMDSVLFALLATPNAFIDKHTIHKRFSSSLQHLCEGESATFYRELQMALAQIIKSIRFSVKKQNVSHVFRKVLTRFANCAVMKRFSNFTDCTQQEALEFLQFLFTCYGLNGDRSVGNEITFRKRYGIFTRSKHRVQWNKWIERTDKKSSLIFRVPRDVFKKYRTLSTYLSYTQEAFDLVDAKFQGCAVNCSQENIRLSVFADLVVISVERQDFLTHMVDHDPISISQTITDSKGKTLYLDAIILHLGDTIHSGHYVCIKRCEKQWIFFDDLSHQLNYFSSWKAISHAHPNIKTHGILYFYTL